MSSRASSDAIRLEPLGRTSLENQGQNGASITRSVKGASGVSANTNIHKRNIYEQNGITVCSQKRALCIATVVFATLFTISFIIAFAGQQNDCSCVGEKLENYNAVEDDVGEPIATNGEIFPWDNVRLPNFAHPTRYNITIHPNLTTLEVKGQVTIEFYVDRDVNYIVFHSKNLTINEKMVQDRKGHRLKISKLLEYTKHQQIYLELEESKFRRKGNYTLHLRFVSRLRNELDGFYLSSYVNLLGDKRGNKKATAKETDHSVKKEKLIIHKK